MLDARRHLHALAVAHGVTLHWCDTWEQAESFAGARLARVPWIEDGSDYLIALHELGHVLAPGVERLEGSTDPFTNLALEGLAWAWAVTNARADLLEPDDWYTPAYALATHYENEVARSPHDPAPGAVSQSDQIADT